MSIDPIRVCERIEEQYRSYLRSSFPIADKQLAKAFEDGLKERFPLSKGPLLEATPPYETGATLRELVDEGIVSGGFLDFPEEALPVDRPLYSHQEEALRKASEGRNLLIATGTGSGKTECFLLPIIDALLKERESGTLSQPGVRALLLYPMNALANDQLKRLRTLFSHVPDITFGRYTGETKQSQSNAEKDFHSRFGDQELLPNELISRDAINEAPPSILLTNYAMLEYLLLRPSDSRLFDGPTGSHWRFIALDEIHVYDGSAGTEVGLLLRRLKERVLRGTNQALQCFGTSATVGSGEVDFPQLTEFAEELFGEPFTWDPPRQRDVIGPTRKDLSRGTASTTLEPSEYARLGRSLADGDEERLAQAADTLSADKRVVELQRMLAEGPVDMRKAANNLFDGPGRLESLTALIDAGVRAKHRSDSSPVLPARYHFFLRALEGAYLCLHPDHPNDRSRLRLTRHSTCEDCSAIDITSKMFELGACQICGAHYVIGKIDSDSRFEHTKPVDQRPDRGLIGRSLPTELLPDEDEETIDPNVDEEAVEVRLCPSCGVVDESQSLVCRNCETETPLQSMWLARASSDDRKTRQCLACSTRRDPDPVRRFTAGAEAPVSVIATDLFQELPPSQDASSSVGGGRKLLAFSDSRQDAAFFAPYLSRTYNRAVQRRLTYEALSQIFYRESEAPRSDELASHVKRLAETVGVLDPEENNRVAARTWIMQEILAMDRRQSLEGTGLAEIRFVLPRDLDVPAPVSRLGFDIHDYRSLLSVLLGTLRAGGAVFPLDGVDMTDPVFSPRNRTIGVKEQRAGDMTIGWLPSRAANRRLDYVSRLFAKRDIDADPREFLKGLWKVITSEETWAKRFKKEDTAQGPTWLISPQWLEFHLGAPDRAPMRCSQCSQLWWDTVSSVCPGFRCEGSLASVSDTDHLLDNHYARLYRRLEPIAMEAQEHTAQWTSSKASSIQEDFTTGKVNVLSCSTTFELGVDVGDVEAVLLRNVPPRASNYVQRAGRAGRRTGSAALVVTFAQMRSHDLTFFKNPHRLVAGQINPPQVAIDNLHLARRHVHSIAFAMFQRTVVESKTVGEFFTRSNGSASPMELFEDWLRSKPEELKDALVRAMPEELHSKLDLNLWGWVDALLVEHDEDIGSGWLARAQNQVYDDLSTVEGLIEEAAQNRNFGEAKRLDFVLRTLETRRLIEFLASRNVLPKYGFPVDVVSLNLAYDSTKGAKELQLDRDLKMAILDYAPGAVTVAGSKLWESVGLARRPEKGWRRFGWAICGECGHFRQAIVEAPEECQACGSARKEANKHGTYAVPDYGFIGRYRSDASDRRPERVSFLETHFGDYPYETPLARPVSGLAKGTKMVFGRQGMITVINVGPSRLGFRICDSCGYGQPAASVGSARKESKSVHRRPWGTGECSGSLQRMQLGHNFLTDVVQLLPGKSWVASSALQSALYALLAAAPELGVPRDDVDGALHWVGRDEPALVIFDAVPGGAGHARRLSKHLPDLVRSAYEKVSDCECGVETSCYSCLRTYRNQLVHDELTREGAMQLLESMLPSASISIEATETNSLITVAAPATQTPEARNKIDALDEESLELADESCRPLIVAAVKSGLEMPIIGFELQSGEILEAAWPQAKVAITLEDGSPDGWDCRMPDEWDVDSLRQALSQKE